MTTQYFKVRNGLTVGEDAVTVDGTTGATTIAGEYTLPVVDGSADQIIKTDGAGNLSWYTPTDTNTTYTIDASSTTGGANLNLVGSDSSTDTVKIASGTGVTVAQTSANELSVAIGQPVGTTDDVIFDTVDANITDDNYVLGQLVYTRNTAYTPPASALTTLAGQNGVVISSSSGGLGYSAALIVRYHSGDTTAGVASSAGINQGGASGTSTSPGGSATNQVMGTMNFDGYTAGTSSDWASIIATTNQGAGIAAIQPLQAQAYARQAFTNSTTFTTAVTGASGTGSVATLTFTTQNTAPYVVGQTVTVAGMTPSGYNGTVVLTAATTSSISYANATTGFTSGGTIAAANTVTAAGMGFRIRSYANSTNLTAANRFNFMDLTASGATFKSNAYTFANEVITGSTLTATNYMSLTSSGHTIGNVDSPLTINRASGANTGTRPVASLKNTQTATTTPTTGDGASFRQIAQGSNGTSYNLTQISGIYNSTGDTSIGFDIANGDQTTSTMSVLRVLDSKLSSTTIKAAASVSATPGANSVTNVAVFTTSGVAITGDITATGRINNYDKIYGSFFDTADQPNPVANAENLMILGTTDIASDVSIVSNGTALTRITIAKVGIYNIQFSAQLSQTSGGAANAFIWLKKNGTNVANTAGDTQVAGNGDKIMAAWNYVVSAAAGDYFELAWAATNTSVILDNIAAAGVVPGIPSVILTVVPVGA